MKSFSSPNKNSNCTKNGQKMPFSYCRKSCKIPLIAGSKFQLQGKTLMHSKKLRNFCVTGYELKNVVFCLDGNFTNTVECKKKKIKNCTQPLNSNVVTFEKNCSNMKICPFSCKSKYFYGIIQTEINGNASCINGNWSYACDNKIRIIFNYKK